MIARTDGPGRDFLDPGSNFILKHFNISYSSQDNEQWAQVSEEVRVRILYSVERTEAEGGEGSSQSRDDPRLCRSGARATEANLQHGRKRDPLPATRRGLRRQAR